MDYKNYFKGKKVTVMGLGLLGRGLNDTIFLALCGADLTVTDMKTTEELAPSVEKLKNFPAIKFKLGGHDLEDFKNCDMVLKAAGVPLDSIYIKEAKNNNIKVVMDSSLFIELAPEGVIVIGITGTRGKSTVTHLIHHILVTAGLNSYLGGNVRDTATLPLIKEIKSKDYVVLELDSWQLQGFGDAQISPHVAVFTAFMHDHVNYYKNNEEQYFKDKANIYGYQNSGDVLVAGEDVANVIAARPHGKGDFVIAKKSSVPKDWKINIKGDHNLLNISCAIEATRALGISENIIKEGVETFVGIEGRLQFLKEVGGVSIYNDNNATTPEATIAGLRALGSNKKNIILILGGEDKKLDMSELVAEIPKWCSKVILFKEKGTDLIKDDIFNMEKSGIKVFEEEGLENTVRKAVSVSSSGEIILYSPAFSSFGKYFKNEYDRNDQFIDIISKLK